MLAWPSISWMMRMSTPSANSRQTPSCRRSCQRRSIRAGGHEQVRSLSPKWASITRSIATPSLARRAERQFEMEPFGCLEVLEYFEEIASLRVAVWTQHAHQALRRSFGPSTQLFESDGR